MSTLILYIFLSFMQNSVEKEHFRNSVCSKQLLGQQILESTHETGLFKPINE